MVKNAGGNKTKAAELLGISDRHFRRLLKAYREQGTEGLQSKKRGKPSNRRLPAELKKKALKAVSGKYKDFGPSFATEKLKKKIC